MANNQDGASPANLETQRPEPWLEVGRTSTPAGEEEARIKEMIGSYQFCNNPIPFEGGQECPKF